MKVVGSNLDLNNRPIVNVPTPSGGQDAANKDYVDASVRGLSWKDEVRAASTGNLTLSAAQTVDGVALVAGDRVLVKDQTTQTQNGIYVVAAGAWTRALDADSAGELAAMTVTVDEGTVNAGRVYTMAGSVGAITVGTTNLTYAQVGGAGGTYTAGNGLTLSGQDFNVGAGTGISVQADTVSVDTAVVVRKFSADIGNGSLTAIPVVHNLGTLDVHCTVYDKTSKDEVIVDIVHTDANTVTITFASAPAAAAYRAVVFG